MTSSPFSGVGYSVAWNGTRWLAGGQGGNTLAYSADGITWIGVTSSPFSNYGASVAWNGTRCLAAGSGGNTLAYSADGITWTGLTTSSPFDNFGIDVAWNGTRWVAAGGGSSGALAYSDNNGISWTPVTSSPFSGSVGAGLSVAWNGYLGGNTLDIDTTLVINRNTNTTGSGRLDIVADAYYNTGFTNMSISVKSDKLF